MPTTAPNDSEEELELEAEAASDDVAVEDEVGEEVATELTPVIAAPPPPPDEFATSAVV